MILEGEKIRLRPFAEKDFEKSLEWRYDMELRMLGQFHPFPITEDLERDWVESILKNKTNNSIYFAIETKANKKLIGYFQLKNINWISQTAWLGIIIGDRSTRGKGYGKETMLIGLQYAKNALNIRKVSLELLANNTAALKLYEKLGFKKEGTLISQVYYCGQYMDVNVMSTFLNT